MNDDSPEAAEPPPPVYGRRAHYTLWLVWLVPVLAVAIAIGLGVRAMLDRGPTVTIHFHNAEGLEAGKTRIKYKDVDIGQVKRVRLTADHALVEVTAELDRAARVEDLLVRDTRFWVVRPRVGAGGVSGLGTLLSGAYIGMAAGHDTTAETSFRGLDQQPILAEDVPGRHFRLQADELGSLDIGSPLYYRRVPVGQVVAYELAGDGRRVGFTVFVAAPYDRFVTARTRFWHASGVEVTLDTEGVRVATQSLASILAGGIAFQDLDVDQSPLAPAPENAVFTLHARQAEALKQPDAQGFDYRLLFRSSVRGLAVGAPVDYRGLSIGEVTRIAVEGTAGTRNPNPQIAVDIRVFPSRLQTIGGAPMSDKARPDQRARLDPMVARGFRAQLRNGSLLTGQLYVALDFFPGTPAARIDWRSEPPALPTVPGSFDSLQETLTHVVAKLDQLPLDTLAQDLHRTLGTLDQALQHTDALITGLNGNVAPEAQETLREARRAMTDLRHMLGTLEQTAGPEATQTLQGVARAAQSLRQLADYLEQHPETLLRGKPEDPK